MGNFCGREHAEYANENRDTVHDASKSPDTDHNSRLLADPAPHQQPHPYENANSIHPPMESNSDSPPPPYTRLPDSTSQPAVPWDTELPQENAAQPSIEQGVDVNAPGGQALLQAIELHQGGVARLLIETGADVNAVDGRGRPALLRAIELHQEDVAQLLIERSAQRERSQADDRDGCRG